MSLKMNPAELHAPLPDRLTNLTEEQLAKLSHEDRIWVEHQKLHEKHRGHEAMHVEMFFILIGFLCVGQILLVQWKKRHFKSYQLVSLLGMWIIPCVLCIVWTWYRFVFIWCIFSAITAFITYKATRKPIEGTTPRLVYKWFLLIHKTTYGLGIVGYFALMFTLFGLNILILTKPKDAMDFSVLLLFYGFYYGVVGRDFAEVCTDKMATHIGYYTPSGLPGRHLEPNTCAVCGNPILVHDNDEAIVEKSYKLGCGHIFHEFCIRGWLIVGKKQTCPYCKEKVDTKRMFTNPWERPHLLFGHMLDWMRFLVAWQPTIILLVRVVYGILGLE